MPTWEFSPWNINPEAQLVRKAFTLILQMKAVNVVQCLKKTFSIFISKEEENY